MFFFKKFFLPLPAAACCALLIVLALPCRTTAEEQGMSVRPAFAQDAGRVLAVLELDIPAGHHAYAPGNSEGKPTSVALAQPSGHCRIWYPAGEPEFPLAPPDRAVYRKTVRIFLDLGRRKAGTRLEGTLAALLCSDARCLPQRISFSAAVPQQLPVARTQPWHDEWSTLKRRPGMTIQALPPAATPAPSTGVIPMQAIPMPSLSGSGTAPGDALSPAAHSSDGHAALPPLEPRYAIAALEVRSLGKALGLGFLAGLLLNIMPCVLPVLTLKMSGLLLAARGEEQARLRRFREHNLYFAAGIMTWFAVLAIMLGMAGAMWGQLFQHEAVIFVMLLIVFLLGLSMLGVFTLPVIDLKSGASGSPRAQAFSTGLLATLLATPCSGPLLGGVLGWAFTQPTVSLVVVFCAVGMGMSLPYILFAFRPHLVRLLPRPGAWMGVLEKIMGFFLLGTALYLLSILPPERHLHVLAGLLLTALCAWLWGQFCGYAAPPRRRRWGAAAGACLLAGGLWCALQPPQPGVVWQEFATRDFLAMLGKRPMLVEFTADWCPNCKFLEASVLNDRHLRAAQERYGITFVRADLTREDAAAGPLLEKLGARSIPVTALFPAGADSVRPLVLRDVYTAATLEDALRATFPPVEESSR